MMRKLHTGRRPGCAIQVQAKLGAFFQLMGSISKFAHPQLRSLQIRQNPDGATNIAFDLANDSVPFADFYVIL